jgi:hypothetical protein
MNADALKQLRQTHAAGCQLLQRFNYKPESIGVAIEVEKNRWYWKPEQPKLILVAESHVFTTEREFKFQLDESKIRPFIKSKAALPPNHFTRFVYCLGYGESESLIPEVPQISNMGTPTYWDIFGRVAFRCPQPRRDKGANFKDRLRWKVDTLREVYRMGIWLLDASVHAIYRRNEARLPIGIQEKLHKQWWTGYGKYLVASCGSPKVWVIGRMVHNCFSKLNFNDWHCDGWIYQPNATGFNLNHNWPRLLDDCGRLR